MQEQLYPEWRDESATTRYPFVAAATLTSRDRRVVLEGTFLDGALYPVGHAGGLWLSNVRVVGGVVTLAIGDSRRSEVATASLDAGDPPDLVSFRDPYGRPAGALVVDPVLVASLAAWGEGDHALDALAATFAAAVAIPSPDLGLQGILVDGELVAGDVWLVGGHGVQISEEAGGLPGVCGAPATARRGLRIDAIGDPLFQRRQCGGGGEVYPGPRVVTHVRFVGGGADFTVGPDAAGNVAIATGSQLADDPAIRIVRRDGALRIESAARWR